MPMHCNQDDYQCEFTSSVACLGTSTVSSCHCIPTHILVAKSQTDMHNCLTWLQSPLWLKVTNRHAHLSDVATMTSLINDGSLQVYAQTLLSARNNTEGECWDCPFGISDGVGIDQDIFDSQLTEASLWHPSLSCLWILPHHVLCKPARFFRSKWETRLKCCLLRYLVRRSCNNVLLRVSLFAYYARSFTGVDVLDVRCPDATDFGREDSN